MGKATGIGSQWRGKIGNVIGYLSKNRAGRYEQTVKGYQPVVANPQTYAQALARVPVGPVQRVCSALLPLIQRGFEGTAYGDPSKSEFLSYNLKYFRGPFMPKGSVEVPPGPMLISKGSLQRVFVYGFPDGADAVSVTFMLSYTLNTEQPTRGEISANLLAYNPQLQQGEQLTFVVVLLDTGEYVYKFESIYLDPYDESYPRGILQGIKRRQAYLEIATDEVGYEGIVVAAACIRSQPYRDTSFKRSTAFLTLNEDVYLYNDEEAVNTAVATYRDSDSDEDWEDDPTPEYQKLAYVCMVDITADMIITSGSPTPTGYQCMGYVTKGGEMGIFYKYSDVFNANCLIDGHGVIITVQIQGASVPFRYNGVYQPARVYNDIYGTVYT